MPANPPVRVGPPRAPACSRHPALRSPRPSPAPFPCSPRAHAPTAAEDSRRVVTMCRRRPPRGSRGLTSRTRARLQPPQPVRSLTPARTAFPLLQSKKPKLRPSPRQQLRRRRAPAPPRHSPIPRARNSASPSFKSRSRLRRLRAQVEPPRASPPTAMAPPCSAAMEVAFLLFSRLA